MSALLDANDNLNRKSKLMSTPFRMFIFFPKFWTACLCLNAGREGGVSCSDRGDDAAAKDASAGRAALITNIMSDIQADNILLAESQIHDTSADASSFMGEDLSLLWGV